MLKVGPIGRKEWFDESWNEKGRTTISHISVSFDDYSIKSIQFSYFHKGAQVVSKKYGSSKGKYFQIIRLKDDEYVTGLSGLCNTYEHVHVTSLRFHTNQGNHGPICDRHESSVHRKRYNREINVGIRDRREFGGLFGSFCSIDGSLKSIGIYVRPNTIFNDAVLRATCDNQTLGYQNSKIVDGVPVQFIGYKPKLKELILSKFSKAIRFLSN